MRGYLRSLGPVDWNRHSGQMRFDLGLVLETAERFDLEVLQGCCLSTGLLTVVVRPAFDETTLCLSPEAPPAVAEVRRHCEELLALLRRPSVAKELQGLADTKLGGLLVAHLGIALAETLSVCGKGEG